MILKFTCYPICLTTNIVAYHIHFLFNQLWNQSNWYCNLSSVDISRVPRLTFHIWTKKLVNLHTSFVNCLESWTEGHERVSISTAENITLFASTVIRLDRERIFKSFYFQRKETFKIGGKINLIVNRISRYWLEIHAVHTSQCTAFE